MNEIKELLIEVVDLLTQQTAAQKEILSVEDTSKLLRVSKSQIYKLVQRRELPYFCPAGKKYYFKRTDLNEDLTRYRTASASEIEAQANSILNRKRRGL